MGLTKGRIRVVIAAVVAILYFTTIDADVKEPFLAGLVLILFLVRFSNLNVNFDGHYCAVKINNVAQVYSPS